MIPLNIHNLSKEQTFCSITFFLTFYPKQGNKDTKTQGDTECENLKKIIRERERTIK